MATHGELFKAQREALGMTQEELSVALGMAQSSVSAVEKGRFTLSIHKAKAFALLGGFNWVELYEGSAEEKVPAIEANQ